MRRSLIEVFNLNYDNMGLFEILFNSKNNKERNQEKRVDEVLKRTDDFIERTERMLEEMKRDDERWRRNL